MQLVEQWRSSGLNKQAVLASIYLHVYETGIKMLGEHKKHATHQGYYWV
ncbi:MAG TPA: hypothetical protein PKD90_15855 [Phnomibacter sp.]|nr:hypothetical protein [Phnomibacter sp.]